MFGRRKVQLWWFLPVFLSSLVRATPIEAQQADSLAEMVKEVAERSVEKAPLGSGNERLEVRRRQDLENLLLTFEPKESVQDVYFYEIQSPAGRVSDAPMAWVVAAARFGPDMYKFYSFRGSAGPNAPSQEFNRFTSQLALSIPEEKATGLARLFLKSCVEGDAQATVIDNETELRLAVQNYYFAAYGDLWRGLDAYSRWWQGFQAHAPDLAPAVAMDMNGWYRVVLKRLVATVGKHPQVQDWELEISREGKIRIMRSHLIFPDQPSWLFYGLDTWSPFP